MPQLKISKKRWEKEFFAGRWDYLDFTPAEQARSAIIGMLCRHYYPKGKILDVGCGLGTTTDFLNEEQKKKYLGIDISEEAIKKARKKKATFQIIDFTNFKSSTKFDAIVFNEVLYYLDERAALKQVLNLLSNNGIVIISLYKMKNKRYDEKIWKTSRKLFKTMEVIEITSTIKRQEVTWRVETLKMK